MCNKAIMRKPLKRNKIEAKVIDGEAMVIYPDPDDKTPICLWSFGPMTRDNCKEAQRLAANPNELIDLMNTSEINLDSHIRWQLVG
jgi:hypothetical protein